MWAQIGKMVCRKLIFLSVFALTLWTVQARLDIEYKQDRLKRTTLAKAVVTRGDLDTREPRWSGIRKAIDAQKGEDAGHLIARMLGGPSREVENFVRQDPRVNRNEFKKFEKKVADLIDIWGAATVIVSPQYTGSSTRPSAILYTVTQVAGPGFITKNFPNN